MRLCVQEAGVGRGKAMWCRGKLVAAAKEERWQPTYNEWRRGSLTVSWQSNLGRGRSEDSVRCVGRACVCVGV